MRLPLVVLGALLLISCEPEPEDAIVGKWISDGFRSDSSSLEFLDDGTIILLQNEKRSSVANYEFVEEGRMRLSSDSTLGGTQIWGISLSGHKLQTTDPTGQQRTFIKFDPGSISDDLVGTWEQIDTRIVNVEEPEQFTALPIDATMTITSDGRLSSTLRGPDSTYQRSGVVWNSGSTLFFREDHGSIYVSTISIDDNILTSTNADTLFAYRSPGDTIPKKAVIVTRSRRKE